LKERERVPGIGQLLGQNGVHVDGKEGPEDFGVFHQEIAEPGESLQPRNSPLIVLLTVKNLLDNL